MSASAASGATLNVVGGQLVGASGVDVGGTLYDVVFVDGTCVALFDGCDSVSDFTFQTQADALAASQALLDQVFLNVGAGDFDSAPGLTSGCVDLAINCAVTTPFGFDGGSAFYSATAFNEQYETNDGIYSYAGGHLPGAYDFNTYDTALNANRVLAAWTPASVPEPSTALLLGFGLLVLVARRQRHQPELRPNGVDRLRSL